MHLILVSAIALLAPCQAESGSEADSSVVEALHRAGVEVGVDDRGIWSIEVDRATELDFVIERSVRLKHARYFAAINCKIDGSHVVWVRNSAALRSVSFDRCIILAAAWQELAQAKELDKLSFRQCQIEFDGFQEFCDGTNVRELRVDGTPFPAECYAHLVKASKLESLSLARACVNDEGMVFIGRIPLLQGVDVRDSKVTDRGVAHLHRTRERLSSCVLDGCEVGDDACDVLAACPNLLVLSVSRTRVSDRGLAKLTGHRKLSSLAFEQTKVSDESIPTLISLHDLEFCYVGGTRISLRGLGKLEAALPKCAFERLSK